MEAGNGKVKTLADSVSGEGKLPGLPKAVFWQKGLGSTVGSHKGTVPLYEGSTYDLFASQRPLLFIPSP